MTRYFLIAIATFSIFSCDQHLEKMIISPNNSYLFDGTIKGMDSGWLYIGHPDTTGKSFSYLDSSKILNGSFKFTGTISTPEPCAFVFRTGKKSFLLTSYFILDTGHTTGLLYKDSMEKSIIKGTLSQNQYQDFLFSFLPLEKNYYQAFNSLNKNPNDSNLLKLLKTNEADQINLIHQSIKVNSESLVSAFIAYKYIPDFIEVKDLEEIYGLLKNKNNYYSKSLFKSLSAKKRTAIGHIAPAFSISDNRNEKLNNKSFSVNNYFLIDFWASWCVPCRAQNPYLVKAYNSFHNKGFDIISISLDKSKKEWERAVKQDKLPWKQACDTSNLMATSFGIKTIPMNFLIDKEGKIVAKNLRDSQLTKVLSSLIEH